ncbi:hypothetical protein CHH61_26735, partial [Shouchella clausii]
PLNAMPVYGTIASQFNDLGTNTLFARLLELINETANKKWQTSLPVADDVEKQNVIIPPERRYYLREI